MVGLALAIALARLGQQVTVIEKHPIHSTTEPAFDGRVSAIAAGSQHMLAHLGVWPHLAAQAQPIHDIRVSDGDAPIFLHYHYQEVSDEAFGYIVENRHIRAALLKTLQTYKHCQLRDGLSVSTLEETPGGVTLTFSDDSPLRTGLLCAADGKYSAILDLLGIKEQWSQYRQTAIVATIAHSLPHYGLAQERFLPDGPFAVLPMRDQCSSLVWVEPDDRVQTFTELEDAAFCAEVTARVGEYLGDIHVKGPRFTYPLSWMHANTYIKPNVALIGDAAHSIHPIAGQGVNLGFRDVAVLAELAARRIRHGLPVGDAEMLAHYQRWRRPDNIAMLAVTDGLNRLFSNNLLPTPWVRGMGLRAVSQMPALKALFMRHAMGVLGDVPPLLTRDAA